MTAIPTGIDRVTADLSTGHGSAASIAELVDGSVLARMVLLRTLMTEIESEIADEAGLPEAYQRLAELQNTHPMQVRDALSYPHTGTWLVSAIRRMRTATDASDIPFWADCGYLGWLATACAISCEPSGAANVVVRAGAVMLPGLGLAGLADPQRHGHCRVEWSGQSLTFITDDHIFRVNAMDSEDNPGWLPMRRMYVSDRSHSVLLDDLDPHRDSSTNETSRRTRLTAVEAERWQEKFEEAWSLLERDFESYLVPMRDCLKILAPLSTQPMATSTSHTETSASGCVYTTASADPCQLALTLIHEIQHSKLNLLLNRVVLVESDRGPRFYAPWRDDPRPLPGLLHGIYAFFGVTNFWRVHRRSDCHNTLTAHIDFELWRRQVLTAIEQAVGSGALTPEGLLLVRTLATAMAPWQYEQIPPAAKSAAADVVRAHRAFWHVRNLIPDANDIALLAHAWRVGEPKPTRVVQSSPTDQDSIPERYRTLRLSAQLKSPHRSAHLPVGGHDQALGDGALLKVRYADSVQLYHQELNQDPLRPQVWAGLAVVLPKLYPDEDFTILHRQAEVAAWLYRELRKCGVNLLALLRWLSQESVDV
ncbi:HEXXH motif domain-containing protein [Nocardia sp. NPDC004722]